MDTSKPINEPIARPEGGSERARTIDARTLFGQSNAVLIEFKGECYQLRQTRNGKLILTK